jgi:hypothetical protein
LYGALPLWYLVLFLLSSQVFRNRDATIDVAITGAVPGTTNINSIPFRVFHKPFAKSDGGSGEWITRQGMTFTLNRSRVQRWPFLILDGKYNNDAFGCGAPHRYVGRGTVATGKV